VELTVDGVECSIWMKVNLYNSGKDLHSEIHLLEGMVNQSQRASLRLDNFEFALGMADSESVSVESQCLVRVVKIGFHSFREGERTPIVPRHQMNLSTARRAVFDHVAQNWLGMNDGCNKTLYPEE